MNYYGLDPKSLTNCNFCQHHAYDLGKGHICTQSSPYKMIERLFEVNDCEHYKTPFLNDYRRRYDLERELERARKEAAQ